MNNKAILTLYRCERHQSYHARFDYRVVAELKKLLEVVDTDLEIVVEQHSNLFGDLEDHACQIEQTLQNLFSIQGERYTEGDEVFSRIESLIDKYAELKQ